MPKRRETTFTSSGWETKSAMRLSDCAIENWALNRKITQSLNRQISLLRCLLLIPVQNLIHLLRRQVLVKVIIHLRRRSPAAGPNALHLFQREHPIFRGL